MLSRSSSADRSAGLARRRASRTANSLTDRPRPRPSRVEASYDRATDFAAAANHDRAARKMTPDRLAPPSKITAPALIVHGTADPLRPLPHGQALAAQIPHARLEAVPGMGHGFFSPGLPRHIGQLILGRTQSPPSGT